TETCLPLSPEGAKLEHELADYLGISRTGRIMENLRWLGLLSDEKIGSDVTTVAGAMIRLIRRKLEMPKGARDMVILVHEIEAIYPEEGNRKEKITSTMIEYGIPDGFTAISRTVGLPIAVAATLLLKDELPLTGCQIPTHPAVYGPVLRELSQKELEFTERTESLT
ncbi:MAG: saccharopine dehydrogenase C-terminal domain-containing protein, partial [Bacteroidota bacterium]